MEMADGDRLTPEQAEALSALRDGRNVFLSGNAGTGKSYVLNAFISDLKARNVDFLALAPTGIAALNLTDGSTIHRTLKIAPGVCAPDGPKGSRKVLDAAKVIIIDEISMCRIDLFDHVMGMISQSMTRNGAKQVVLVGDFFQLPPVVTERDSALLMKFYPGNLQGWCFKSRYWTGFDFEPHVLKTVVRQSAPDFIDNLNRARVGDASCLDYFNAHSRSSRAYLPKDTLVLCANNRIADSINRENVDALDAPKVEFAAASPPRKREISALAISRSRASSWLPISWNTALSLPVQWASLARLARPQVSRLARALTGSLSQSACLGSSMDALRWVS